MGEESISLTGVIGLFVSLILIFIGYMKFFYKPQKDESSSESEDEKIEKKEFTLSVLKNFNGKDNPSKKSVYLCKRKGI